MNREQEFARILRETVELGRAQGNCVTDAQVQEAFAPLNLSGEQLQLVYDYLLKRKIGINAPVEAEDYLTGEERSYLQNYLDELKELSSLSEGERRAVEMAAMAGDGQAQAGLLQLYLPDVAQIAKLYAGQGVLLEDLIGEGNLALADGVTMVGSLEKPEEIQGMLGKLVMDAMEDFIAENAEYSKADARLAARVNEVADKARDLARDLGRKVTVAELTEESGLSEKRIRDAMRMSGFQIEDIEREEAQDADDAL